ncbi:proline--tRNA ligase [Rickettsiales bacterium LUAb2]
MRLSQFFCPILKEQPKEASIVSHSLMLRSGLIRQTASGIYSFLPAGKIILNKISNIIKEEMDKSGALEMLMPTMQLAEIWQESGRYDDYGEEMLKITDRHKRNMLYGPTNEEQITQIFRENIKSYKQLPLNMYHIQWKFRDEIRPRFGLMRGREFLMKDAYSFDISEEAAKASYYKMFFTYLKIFKRLGLYAIPMKADTGPIGGDLSHEFIILAKTGESDVYYDKEIIKLYDNLDQLDYNTDLNKVFNDFTAYYAATSEMFDANDQLYINNKSKIIENKGIEVGHVFYFGTKYSSPMKAFVLDQNGQNIPVNMGSYGIGVSRLIPALIEANFDDKGIVWDRAVAPFDIIINVLGNDDKVNSIAEDIYQQLLNYNLQNKANISVLLNDLKDSAGSKLATADLLGIPLQINLGSKSVANNQLEIKQRKSLEVITTNIDVALEKSLNILNSLG